MPSISNGPGSSSSVDGRVVADGLLIWWTVTRRELSGMPRPVRVKSDSGAALINLKTREVTTLTPEQASAKLRGSAVPLKAPRLTGTERLYFPPQGADGFLVSVQLGPASAGQRAVLKRWSAETGEPLADVDLGPGYAASSISADGSLFLIVRASGSSDSGGPGYVWSIYRISSGQRLAEVRIPDSAQPFFVWNSILVYESAAGNRRVNGKWQEEPLGLRGLDLKSGTEIWKRPLRDTSYHGPYPPHQ